MSEYWDDDAELAYAQAIKQHETTMDVMRRISYATLENDLDELANLLCIHELDDDIRAVCYVAIDRVSTNLGRLVTIDTLLTL